VSQTLTSPVALIQQQSFAPLVKKVSPAVVNISVSQKADADAMAEDPESAPSPGFPSSPFDEFLRRFFEQQNPGGQRHLFPQNPGGQTRRIALGSGFIIDPSGYVVTNSHVVGDATKVEVTLQDNSKYTAKIVGRDPKTDIAVLKITADKPLPYVEFGDSSAAQVGDWVMAVGNPFGLGGTVTTGIISARGRDIHSGPFDDFLQIDARWSSARSPAVSCWDRTRHRYDNDGVAQWADDPAAGEGRRARQRASRLDQWWGGRGTTNEGRGAGHAVRPIDESA